MDHRTDADDAAFLKQYAEAREKGVSINPAPELLHRAATALGARAALRRQRDEHETIVAAERDAARMHMIAMVCTQRDMPDADLFGRAALALAKHAARMRGEVPGDQQGVAA